MEVTKIKRKGHQYQVIFSNDESFLWCEEIIIKYHILKPKMVIDLALLAQIIDDNQYYEAINEGTKYLNSLKSKKQVINYLTKKYNYDLACKVFDYLFAHKIYDEKAYAESYLYYAIKNGKGPHYIYHELANELIDKEIINQVLVLYTSDLEQEICNRVYLKQMASYKKLSHKAFCQKMTIFLTNRGFNQKIIGFVLANNQRLLDNVIDEEKLLIQAYEKTLRKYEKRYFGKDLEERVLRSLYAKGFSIAKIKNLIESREDK